MFHLRKSFANCFETRSRQGKKEVGCFRITTVHSDQYLVVLFSSQSLLLCWLPHSLWILDYAWHEMARGALKMMLVAP